MTFEDFENLFTLFCTIVGLLGSVFKYIEHPKRGYLFLVIFFLAHFFSDYYWAIYVLIMRSYPNVSEFTVYLGWNIGYVFLFLAVYFLHNKNKRYFHPLMLWPLLTNIPLFFLYIQFGGLFNNIWQVSTTTVTLIFCTKDILFYKKYKNQGISFPHLSLLILIFLITGYGMWTVSCFDWPKEYLNPYLYLTLIGYSCTVLFPWGAGKIYETSNLFHTNKNESELRLQTLLQTIASFIILGICAGGYFLVVKMRNNMAIIGKIEEATDGIVKILLVLSIVLILIVSTMLYFITSSFKNAKTKQREMDAGKLSRLNFIVTIIITIFLMLFAIIFNARKLYDSSLDVVYENGQDKAKMFSTDIENYLTEAETTIRVTAETIDLMKKTDATMQDIYLLLIYQTDRLSKQFDENFTGIYAYIDGQYMDGAKWLPPAGFEPESCDWYKAAVKAGGDIVLVSTPLDVLSDSVVITIAKCIVDDRPKDIQSPKNVVCLDIIIDNLKEITKQIDIAGKGYGMIVNKDGFIVIHHDDSYNNKNITENYGSELLSKITNAKTNLGKDAFQYVMDNEECTLFVCPILDQWFAVIVVSNSELLEDVNSQLAVNTLISLIIFSLILFFYYLGYKNERNYGKKVEEMNLQVVTALAASIDAKDNYTNGHSARVANYSRMIASRVGYSESKQDELYMMALLHDVGKIGVPDGVIKKNGKLTLEEYDTIRKHPEIGSRILSSIKERPRLYIGARSHHERYGGGGYPDGIAGEKIPEEARIIAVADAYDAMTSNRSYRKIMPQDKVREEIENGSGTQFDPRFAQVMIQLIDEDTNYEMCASDVKMIGEEVS